MSIYRYALTALRRERITVCVPGVLDGEPVVSTHSWPANRDAMPFLFDDNPDVRASFLFGVCQVAHHEARAAGVVTYG